mgnify:CR=1 FL=1
MKVDVEKRDFFKEPFSESELKKIIKMTGRKPIEMIRKRDKMYKELDFGRIWAGLSYRRSFDGAEYSSEDALGNTTTQAQKLEYITPLLGIEVNSFVFAYNYSYQSNSIVFDNGGYHQITLGINLGCKKQKYDCNCPGIN